MEINSIHNQYIKDIAKLRMKKYREQKQLFIVEGHHMVQEASYAGCIKDIIVRSSSSLKNEYPDAIIVSDEVMKKLSETISLLDILAVCKYPETTQQEGNKVILLDGIQDPGNLGTILRTALSFGYNDIYLSKDTVDLYNEKVLRSTQGAVFTLQIQRTDLIEKINELKKYGYQVYGTALKNSEPLSSFHKIDKVALIFGNEGQGMRSETLDCTTRNIYIEMNQFESLNVAVAAGIAMYHFK